MNHLLKLLLLGLIFTGCKKSEEPKEEMAQEIPQGSSLDQAAEPKAVSPVEPFPKTETIADVPEKFPEVDKQFVPENPQLPPTGLPTAADLPAAKDVTGYQTIGFAKLASYAYETDVAIAGAHTPPELQQQPESKTKTEESKPAVKKTGDDQIPQEIKSLNEKNITVQGYMIPVDFRRGQTNEFILVSVIPSCFFCQVPMPNQWVEVKMKEGMRVDYPGDGLITVAGKISIGALYEGDYLRNVYRMEGHQVVGH